MVGLTETPGDSVPDTPFSIQSQKVELDIDILSRRLKGTTEITVNPHSKELKTVSLNCRQCHIQRITVNGRPCSNYTYDDPYAEAKLPGKTSVNQWKMLKDKIQDSLKDPPEEELVINFPKSVKIDDLDPFATEPQKLLLPKRDSVDGSALDTSQVAQAAIEQSARFTQVKIVVQYAIEEIRDGMHFVGWEDGDLRYAHAYTRNSLSPGAACCLFPCVDKLTCRCTWEISIKCSKTIGDALSQRHVSQYPSYTNSVNGTHGRASTGEVLSNLTADDRSLDLVVVGTGDMTDEIIDSSDISKKTTTFASNVPISAQHIGFAIGPFEHVDLGDFREGDDDDKLGQNAVPTHGFCLPGRAVEMKNTCLPMAKALDFFVMTYGSYPFPNYRVCFVDDLIPDIFDTACLSICSNRLLFPEDVIEPIDRVSRQLVHALAVQWMGIFIIPHTPVDTWIVVGIAYFITEIFLKRLSGNNEYRYRQKKAADRVFQLDKARPSLYDMGGILSLDPSELEFMELKAPVVLFILDRRLTKAGGSHGLSRIIMRLFLHAKIDNLPNTAIDTNYFVKQCEKMGHLKMEIFMAQWVYGAGCPNFRVSQKFNKKKLVVEMLIRQVQEEVGARDLDKETFMREVKEELRDTYAGAVQPVFTGPMTIRIHEADGTPYEHIIEIKEAQTKFDIPYNTKYKRLKRSRRQKERTTAAAGADYAPDGNDDVLLYCLGDVLQTEEEVQEWRLTDWSKEEEDRMSQESYEWIRMDADFEWICKMEIQMPGYMYLSQLQQDRDVVAQLESIQYMAERPPHPLLSTIFVRTLMDRRYFHGIRTTAALALQKHATQQLDWVGLHHLEKAFQELFCFPGSPMPRPNDFSDRATYLIQCIIPQAIAKVRDNGNTSPIRARTFLMEKLRFNDNSNNEFSDGHYIATLMSSLAEAMSTKPAPVDDHNYMTDGDGDDLHFHTTCLEEIDRYRRIDEWIPSYNNVLSRTALDCILRLVQAGATELVLMAFLQHTRDGTADELRLNAFSNLIAIGILNRESCLRWFLLVSGTDPSPYVREHMFRLFGQLLGSVAIGEGSKSSEAIQAEQDGLTIEQETSTEARKAELKRKQTVNGALEALRDELGGHEPLKKGLWAAVTSPTISLREMADLLQMCMLLYRAERSMMVVLKLPKYWECAHIGKGKLRFARSSRSRTRPLPASHQHPTESSSFVATNHAGTIGISTSGAPATMAPPKKSFSLKPPKREPPSLPSGASSLSSGSSTSQPPSAQLQNEEKRPRIILKLGKGGAASHELSDNTVIVLLGASGDLATKKLYPALFNLFRRGILPKGINIVGFDPTPKNHDEYMDHIESCVTAKEEEQKKQRGEFCKRCYYITIDQDGGDKSFEELRDLMESFEGGKKGQNRLFYMALPPTIYVPVSEQLKRCCKSRDGVSRIIVEKPFGKDLESSVDLHKKLAPNWSEDEIFRIDHYLGKEMVKNMLVLRFGNPMFGAVWDCNHIDSVQISMTEDKGTEGRGGYFNDVGIIRDVMQNHLTQMLALLTMERPGSFSAEDLRQEKARVLRLVPPLEMKNTVLGQYVKSTDGEKPGYKDDETVPKESRCATFCATVAYVKDARWQGVPFILKAGKATGESKTEIRIQLKDTTAAMLENTMHNELIIQVQPNEGVRLMMNAKYPGLTLETVTTELDLTYKAIVEDPDLPEAYEALLRDALLGDFSLSVREDELEASWRIFTPLLHHIDEHGDIIPKAYPYGSDGPENLKDFVERYQYLGEKQ